MHKCLSTAYCKYFNDVSQLGTNFQSTGNLECLPKMGILAIESPTSHQLSSYFRDEKITGKLAETTEVIFNKRDRFISSKRSH